MDYDLNEAFERLGVPEEKRSRIIVVDPSFAHSNAQELLGKIGLQLPSFYHPATDYIVIAYRGNKAATDYSLAHEIFGHKMVGRLPQLKLGKRFESYAIEKGLEKMLELGKTSPEHLRFFDEKIKEIDECLTGDFETKNPVHLLGLIIQTLKFYSNMDLARLKKLRAQVTESA